MTERPILFSAPMVRAILEGRKTQTRRMVKPQPVDPYTDRDLPAGARPDSLPRCPFGQPGDRLWVRETWAEVEPTKNPETAAADKDHLVVRPDDEQEVALWYRSDGELPFIERLFGDDEDAIKWRPSIHMPRWASRITLEVTGVRVERLQAIMFNNADAVAEGATFVDHGRICHHIGQYDAATCPAPQEQHPPRAGWSMEHPKPEDECLDTPWCAFGNLWEKLNGVGSWEANPWVWVVSFRRLP